MVHYKTIGYYVGNLFCQRCGKEWVGVWPGKTRLKKLECPNCGKRKVANSKFPINQKRRKNA